MVIQLIKICFFISIFLSIIKTYAQENIVIHLKNEHSEPIAFFSAENVKFKNKPFIADSLGRAKIPYIKGMAYKIHALGFIDTIITLQKQEDLDLTLSSHNTLKEVEIKVPVFSSKLFEMRADRSDQKSQPSAYPGFNHEIGRLVVFEKKIWLLSASFKLLSKYKLDFKKDFFINIYKVNDALEKELTALTMKKPWFYKMNSSPDLFFSSHSNDNYDVVFENNYLSFDLSKLGLYLDEGKYIITIELMAGSAKWTENYFSRQKECLTLRSNNNAQRVDWATELAFGSKKYANVIADFTYKERIENQ